MNDLIVLSDDDSDDLPDVDIAQNYKRLKKTITLDSQCLGENIETIYNERNVSSTSNNSKQNISAEKTIDLTDEYYNDNLFSNELLAEENNAKDKFCYVDDGHSNGFVNDSKSDTDEYYSDNLFSNGFPDDAKNASFSSVLSSSEKESTSQASTSQPSTLQTSTSTKGSKGKTKQSQEEKAKQRQMKKDQAELEKAKKKAALEEIKYFKPKECIKYMYAELHPNLLSKWYMNDLSIEMSSVKANVSECREIVDEALVLWRRKSEKKLVNVDGVVTFDRISSPSDTALLIMEPTEVEELVKCHKLSERLSNVADLTCCRVSLVVYGMKEYFTKSKKKANGSCINQIDLEMAITDLLVSTSSDVFRVETPNELALLIVKFTKAIAETPYKKTRQECDEQAEFYMRGDNKKTITVDKDGHGLKQVWQQMLAVLPHSSLEVARAICAEYKTPLEFYEKCQEADFAKSLSELGVFRSNLPVAKARRIGPEFARKLHTLFTATDGNLLID